METLLRNMPFEYDSPQKWMGFISFKDGEDFFKYECTIEDLKTVLRDYNFENLLKIDVMILYNEKYGKERKALEKWIKSYSEGLYLEDKPEKKKDIYYDYTVPVSGEEKKYLFKDCEIVDADLHNLDCCDSPFSRIKMTLKFKSYAPAD